MSANGEWKRELINEHVEVARRKKWEEGRKEHGPVMLLDPLLELHHEFLDSINYCGVLSGDGQLTPEERSYMIAMANALKSYAGYLQRIHRRNPNRAYVPTEFPYS